MKAVIRTSDGVALYLLPEDEITNLNRFGLSTNRGLRAVDILPETHEIADDVPAPALFVGGAMAWDDGWTITDQDAYDAAETRATEKAHAEAVDAIMAERNRRLAADFEFQEKMFQRDERSLARITGAATLAGFAIAGGARVGDLRWANPNADFGWIASDDTVVPMDAQTCFAFGQTAAGVETRIVFAAKALREMETIPPDFRSDAYWP